MIKYNSNDIKVNYQNVKYYRGKLLPVIPYSETDVYIISASEDRLDLLAYKYYKNVDFWKIIASANSNIPNDSLFLVPGTQLRIPMNIGSIFDDYNKLNKTR